MKITAFDELYSRNLGTGTVYIGGSTGSNSGFAGGDVVGEPGALSVVGMRQRVSLSSNMGDNTVGTVLTTIQSSPWLATFAVSSNTGVSFGSNSADVAGVSAAGAATSASRSDHLHKGVRAITSSSSNTLQADTVNLRPGTNIGFGLSDSDGNGVFDTLTISATATGGTGGSGGAGGIGEYATKYNPDHETPTTTPAVAAEFNGALDSGWTWGTAPPTEDYTTYPGYGLFKTSTGDHWLSKAWTPGASDLTVACKISFAAPNTGSAAATCLFGVSDATGSAPANAVQFGGFWRPGGGTASSLDFYTRDAATYNQRQEVINSLGVINGGSFTIYLRVTRLNSGPTWTCYWSMNGIVWNQFATTNSKVMTVGAIGLRIADNPGNYAVDWIRGWTSIVERVGK